MCLIVVRIYDLHGKYIHFLTYRDYCICKQVLSEFILYKARQQFLRDLFKLDYVTSFVFVSDNLTT